jgi:hypothetical protein
LRTEHNTLRTQTTASVALPPALHSTIHYKAIKSSSLKTQNQSLIFSFAKNLRAQLITKCKAGGSARSSRPDVVIVEIWMLLRGLTLTASNWLGTEGHKDHSRKTPNAKRKTQNAKHKNSPTWPHTPLIFVFSANSLYL